MTRVFTSICFIIVFLSNAFIVNSGVLEQHRQVSAYEMDTVQFACHTGEPPAEWATRNKKYSDFTRIFSVPSDGLLLAFKRDGRFSVSADMSSGFYNLTIVNVTLKETGIYYCIEDDRYQTETRVQLTVLVSPSLFETVETVSAIVRDNVTLPCMTSLGASVNWLQINSMTSQQSALYSNNAVAKQYQNKSTVEVNKVTGYYNLSLYSLQLGDSGWYVCIEEEGIGRKHVFAVNVSVLPYVNMTARVGDNLTLTCISTTSVLWQYRAVETSQSTDINGWYTVNAPRGEYNLTIYNALSNDKGWYDCIENNGYGRIHTFILHMHALVISYVNMTAFVGATVTLSCMSTTAVLWQYRAVETSQPMDVNNIRDVGRTWYTSLGEYYLKLYDTQLNDSGWYDCIENNGYGRIHTIDLHVFDIYVPETSFAKSSVISSVVIGTLVTCLTLIIGIIVIIRRRRGNKRKKSIDEQEFYESYEERVLINGLLRRDFYRIKLSGDENNLNNKLKLLEFDILSRILTKSAVLLFRHYIKFERQADVTSLVTLCSVCWNWQFVFQDDMLKNEVQLRLKLKKTFHSICRPYRLYPQRVKKFKFSGCPVNGVTVCNNCLYVVHDKFISVFDVELKYQQLDDIRLDTVIEDGASLTDIVSSEERKQLFVCDYFNGRVIRVNVADSRHSPVIDVFIKLNFRPDTMSIQSTRLLITPDTWPQHIEPGHDSLNVYDIVTGQLVQRVPLLNHSHVITIHAVETRRATFIVCRQGRDNLQHHEVVELDTKGHVLRVFGGLRGDGPLQLNDPRYLSLDVDGRVFVANSNSNRILLLSNELQIERVLLTSQREKLNVKPDRMCYNQQTGQLIIGHETERMSGFVNIFYCL